MNEHDENETDQGSQAEAEPSPTEEPSPTAPPEDDAVTVGQPEPGWYPDPEDPSGTMLRFWDGSAWTDQRSGPAGGNAGQQPPGAAQPVQMRTTLAGDDERRNILAQQIQMSAVRGLRVETQDRYQAIMIEGQPVNHVLHAIITIFSCGLWGIVWAILAATGGERRHLISVDEYGNVVHQQLGKA